MTALEEAKAVQPGTPVRWRAIQAAAFHDQPGVLFVLDPTSRLHGVRGALVRAKSIVVLLAILAIVGLVIAPVVVASMLIVDAFFDPDPDSYIPTGAIIFVLTLPLLLYVYVAWRRSDRGREPFRELQVFVLWLFGLISVLIALIRSAVEAFPAGFAWSIGIAVPTLLAAMFWSSLLRTARQRQRDGVVDRPKIPTEPLRHVRLAVEKLPEGERAVVRADLTAAIDDLEARGVIDRVIAARARGAELGKLPMTVSQSGPIG